MHIAILLFNKLKTTVSIISLITASFSFAVYILLSLIFQTRVLPNTYINNQNVSFKNQQTVDHVIDTTTEIPKQIEVTVANETRYLLPSEIELKPTYSSTELFNIYSERTKPYSIFTNLDLLIAEKNISIKTDFNEEKLNQWFNQNFDKSLVREKQKPVIEVNSNNEIIKCISGIGSVLLPSQKAINSLSSGEKIPESMTLTLEYNQLTEDEIGINQICNKISNFENNFSTINDQLIIEKGDFQEVFTYELDSNNNLNIILKNEYLLREKITTIKKTIDTTTQIPNYKNYNGTLYLLGNLVPGKIINIDKTLKNIKDKLNRKEYESKFELEIDTISKPNNIAGLPYLEFPVKISEGMSRFSMHDGGWTQRASTRNNILKGLNKIDGYIIQPNTTISLTKILDAQVVYYDQNMDGLGVSHGNISYGAGICGVSTVMFRSSLEAGFPIIERYGHQQALRNYNYPYEGLVDAALFFYQGYNEDFKFKNDTPYPILIVSDSWTDEEDIFNYQVKFFAQEGFDKKNIEITDFYREEHTKGAGFKESFVRYIEGVPETFETQYYLSDF